MSEEGKGFPVTMENDWCGDFEEKETENMHIPYTVFCDSNQKEPPVRDICAYHAHNEHGFVISLKAGAGLDAYEYKGNPIAERAELEKAKREAADYKQLNQEKIEIIGINNRERDQLNTRIHELEAEQERLGSENLKYHREKQDLEKRIGNQRKMLEAREMKISALQSAIDALAATKNDTIPHHINCPVCENEGARKEREMIKKWLEDERGCFDDARFFHADKLIEQFRNREYAK